MSALEQRRVLKATSNLVGIPDQAVEKDLWVTTILQLVFSLPFADKIIFKGGTSLSKISGLINRFSEDIDLAVDRSLFGFEGDLTKKKVKQLRKASSVWVREEFCAALAEAIQQNGLDALCTIEVEPDGEGDKTYPEPRKVWIHYKSAVSERLTYLSPEVMLEIGSRSLIEPFETKHVHSIVEEKFPTIQTTLLDSPIYSSTPAKTFLEKVFLLHEIFSVPGRATVAERKSRHLYDIHMMMNEPFAQEAIHDDALWESIRHHREIFTSVNGMDYTPDVRQRLVLVPTDDVFAIWQNDYNLMQKAMIYGTAKPDFATVIDSVKRVEQMFHKS